MRLGAGVKIAQAGRGTPWAAVAVFREDCTALHLEHATSTQLATLHIQAGSISVNMISVYCKSPKKVKVDMRRSL